MNILRLIPHPHIWIDTRVNPLTHTATEQKCAICNSFRYHLWADRFGIFASENKWRNGKFPEEFKTENQSA